MTIPRNNDNQFFRVSQNCTRYGHPGKTQFVNWNIIEVQREVLGIMNILTSSPVTFSHEVVKIVDDVRCGLTVNDPDLISCGRIST